MRKIRIILIISIFVLLFYTSFIILNKEETVFINIRGNNLVLKVSDSKFEKEMGLSNTKKITHDGMFFIFDNSDFYSFWMKDMNYPIDIIWLDESFNVVHMEKVVKPDTYPNTFKPLKKSMYVLELRSGSIDRLNINLGDYINIKK